METLKWMNNTITYLDGKPHSFDDKPAAILANGMRVWCDRGKVTRFEK
jgi:hypothetical protein